MNKKIISIALASMMTMGSFAIATEGTEVEKELINSKSFISGYEDKTFKPDASVNRAEIATIISRALELEEAQDTFPDVIKGHWASKFIGALQEAGYVKGDQDGNYNPDKGLTRAELATIVYNIEKASEKEEEAEVTPEEKTEAVAEENTEAAKEEVTAEESKENKFSDIDGHWAAVFINELAEKKLVSGYSDGTFGPEKEVTRAEAVTMILNVLKRNINKEDVLEKLENKFTDIGDKHWAIANVLAASNDYEYEIVEEKEVIVVEEKKEETPAEEVVEESSAE